MKIRINYITPKSAVKWQDGTLKNPDEVCKLND